MPKRESSLVLGDAPCHSRASNTNAVPAGPVAGTVGILCGTDASGSCPLRWLFGTMRVAPFCSVKSVIIHMAFTATAGAMGRVAGDGLRHIPSARVMLDNFGLDSPGETGCGIHH